MGIFSGTNENDSLIGGQSNDSFSASTGSDYFNGGDGIDRVSYSLPASSYKINFVRGSVQVKKPDGIDTLENIEQLKFGAATFSISDVRVKPLSTQWGFIYPGDVELLPDGQLLILQFNPNWGGQGVTPQLTKFSQNLIDNRDLFLPMSMSVSAGQNIKTFKDLGGGLKLVTRYPDSSGVYSFEISSLNDDMSLVRDYSFTSWDDPEEWIDTIFPHRTNPDLIYIKSSKALYSYDKNTEVLNKQFNVGRGNLYQQDDGSFFRVFSADSGVGPLQTPNYGYLHDKTFPQNILFHKITSSGDDITTPTIVKNYLNFNEQFIEGAIPHLYGAVFTSADIAFVWSSYTRAYANNRQEFPYLEGSFINVTSGDVMSSVRVEGPYFPSLIRLSNGNIAVVWSGSADWSFGGDGSEAGIFGVIIAPDGTVVVSPFQINNNTIGNQLWPLVDADQDGGFVVYWNSDFDGGMLQRIDAEGNPRLVNITGTAAADVIFTDEGDQQILGGGGNDSLSAGLGEDILIGGAGVDSLEGGGGDDMVFGGEGGDVIVGGHGEGNDRYDGGAGIDTVTYRSAVSGIEVDLKYGYAKSISSDAGIGSDTIASVENVIAGSYSDILKGDDASNSINAGEGSDELYGRSGSDSLSGGVGNDTLDGGSDADDMYGGAGNDTYYVDNAADKVYEVSAPGQTANAGGVDTVIASLSYKLGSFIENLTLTGTVGLTGAGNTLNNTLTGTSGDDTLDGLTGVDALIGGAGNDTYVVDNVNDVVTEDDSAGTDWVRSSVSFILGDNIENLTLTGTAGRTGTGNGLNNTLTGSAGNDALNGMVGNDNLLSGAGNDTLSGGQGNDSLDGGVGNDVLNGDEGDDALTGGAGIDTFGVTGGSDAVLDLGNGGADVLNVAAGATANATVTAAWTATAATVNRGIANISTNGFAVNLSAVTTTGTNGFTVTNTTTNTGARVTLAGSGLNDTLIGGSSNDTLVGNAGNDSLSGGMGIDSLNGGAGADVLDGGVGNDMLIGGDGADTLAGGDGADSLTGGSGADVFVLQDNDTVTDYDGTQSDTVNLTALADGNTVTFTTVRGQLNLSSSSSSAAFIATANASGSTITGGMGADTVNGGNGVDVLTGGGGTDRLSGNGGNDLIRGGIGADTLTGGAGRDTFLFSGGDSSQATGFDQIMDFAKGRVGTGDLIDYETGLTRGGNANVANDTQASINQTTGIATFASGSGTTLADALNDIARRFTDAIDSAGEFALFRVNNAGNYYMFVSDGMEGVTANDVVVQLVGVPSVASIDLTGGNLTILT